MTRAHREDYIDQLDEAHETKNPIPTKESLRQRMEAYAYSKHTLTEDYIEETLKIALLPKVTEARRKMLTLRSRFVEQNRDRVRQQPGLAVIRGPISWWMNEAKFETLDMIRAGRLQVPTLIIWGFNDRSAPVNLGIDLFKLISSVGVRSRFYAINKCGHAPFEDYPEEVNHLVTDFIHSS